jgi:hypothetical protein
MTLIFLRVTGFNPLVLADSYVYIKIADNCFEYSGLLLNTKYDM